MPHFSNAISNFRDQKPPIAGVRIIYWLIASTRDHITDLEGIRKAATILLPSVMVGILGTPASMKFIATSKDFLAMLCQITEVPEVLAMSHLRADT